MEIGFRERRHVVRRAQQCTDFAGEEPAYETADQPQGQSKTQRLSADVRSLVETFIQPIIEEIRSSDGGSFYIRFLSQAIGHPLADVREYSETMLTGAAMSAYELLKAALPDIPAPIIGQRFGLMWEMIIHALADRERYTNPESTTFEQQSELFISNLIDTVAGGLSAPVAPSTRDALAKQAR